MTTTQPPVVVLIGRTNAGKSTLFNRLTEERKAIVSPLENTTRDQTRGHVYWKGSMFELIDTGGLDTAALDPLNTEIQRQVQRALNQAAAIIFVVDGKSELMPQDRETARLLQASGKPVILCVNKVDGNRERQGAAATFAPLPRSEFVTCSASNGSGTGDLLDVVCDAIPEYPAPADIAKRNTLTLSIIGQPNVGKSTLFNALVGEDRVIVSDLAHTTRDINDTVLEYNNQQFTILDTAGIRRKNKVGRWNTGPKKAKYDLARVERESVHSALRSIEEADIVALVVEAQQRIQKQDKVLIDHIRRHGKGLVVVVNKWDLIPDKDTTTINEYQKYFDALLELEHTPLVFVSGLKKQRVTDILNTAMQVQGFREFRMDPADLDRILREIERRQPREKKKLMKGQPKKILKLTSLSQIDVNPPTFQLKAPQPKNVAPAIIHMIENKIRDRAHFSGVPINIVLSRG